MSGLGSAARNADPNHAGFDGQIHEETQANMQATVTWETDSSGVYDIPVTITPTQTADASSDSNSGSILSTLISGISSDLLTSESSTSIATSTSASTSTSTSLFSVSSTSSPASSTTATTTSPSATNSPTTTSTRHSSGDSTRTKLAIALPISIIGTLILVAFVYFFVRRRRHGPRTASPAYEPTREIPDFSTSDLMDPPPEPAARNTPRFPMLDISDGGDNESTFGALSEDLSPHGDRGVQLGFGFASSRDHRISRGAQDMGTISRSASFSGLEPSGESAEDSASLVSPGLGHENPDDGAVSPISAYNDDDGFRGYPPGNSRR